MLVSTSFLSFQILNTKVIFDAQVIPDNYEITGDLTYGRVAINIGEALDASSGIFKVPISGIYKMTFSGASAYSKITETAIYVIKNGSKLFFISDGNDAENANRNNVSYTWMMTLVQGDELKLQSTDYLYSGGDSPLTFTGELIHIEN